MSFDYFDKAITVKHFDLWSFLPLTFSNFIFFFSLSKHQAFCVRPEVCFEKSYTKVLIAKQPHRNLLPQTASVHAITLWAGIWNSRTFKVSGCSPKLIISRWSLQLTHDLSGSLQLIIDKSCTRSSLSHFGFFPTATTVHYLYKMFK